MSKSKRVTNNLNQKDKIKEMKKQLKAEIKGYKRSKREASLIGKIYNSFTRSNEFLDRNKNLHPDTDLGWNIVMENVTKKEYGKMFGKVHLSLKYKLIVPLVWISKRFLGKYLISKDKIAEKSYNDIIKLWMKNYETSLKEWSYFMTKPEKKKDAKWTKNYYKKGTSVTTLREINKIFMTVVLNEPSAYRAFFEILSINWAISCSKRYGKTCEHFVYNSKSIQDKNFMAMAGTNSTDFVYTLPDGNMIVVPRNRAIIVEKKATQAKKNSSIKAKK